MVIRQYLSYEVSVTFSNLLFWVLNHTIIVIVHSNGHIAQIAISLKHPNNFNFVQIIRNQKIQERLCKGCSSCRHWQLLILAAKQRYLPKFCECSRFAISFTFAPLQIAQHLNFYNYSKKKPMHLQHNRLEMLKACKYQTTVHIFLTLAGMLQLSRYIFVQCLICAFRCTIDWTSPEHRQEPF